MSIARARKYEKLLRRGGAVLVTLGLVLFSQVARGDYVYSNIIDTTSGYNGFLGGALNNSGQVGFEASIGPNETIFTSNGTSMTTIAQTGPSFSILFAPTSINDSGAVAFQGLTPQSVYGLFTGSGGSLTTIATEGATFNSLYGGSINNSGSVAFIGNSSSAAGVYVGSGGALTTIAQTGTTYNGFGSIPAINQSGTVAFQAGLTGGGAGVFAGNGSSTTTIFSTALLQPGNATINHAGTAAFDLLTSSSFSIVTGNGGALSTIASTTGGVFSNFQPNPDINNQGQVAFLADLTSGGTEIFVGTTGGLDKVIATGDSLFNSTVSYLAFESGGFNDHGQVSFFYVLANGVNGIGLATPVASSVPEPQSIVLAFMGLGLVVLSTLRIRGRALRLERVARSA
jgi:hypothetical protein